MSTFADPTVAWAGPDDPARPLVVLLHGRGATEAGIIGLADHLPAGPWYAAVRAPIGVTTATPGSSTAASAARSRSRWLRRWPGSGAGSTPVAPAGRPVVLVGFSGGANRDGSLSTSPPANAD